MEIREVMTEEVVTAPPDCPVRQVAEIMRERNVGSVIVLDGVEIVGFVTDRDLALSVVADGRSADEPVSGHASSPVVTGRPAMDIDEAVELMARNGIRRLPVLDGDHLTGIVTLDDLVIRLGDATISATVTRAALPGFYFHDRGG
jgi:CBS domain-containing protein